MVRELMRSDCVSITDCGGGAAILVLLRPGSVSGTENGVSWRRGGWRRRVNRRLGWVSDSTYASIALHQSTRLHAFFVESGEPR